MTNKALLRAYQLLVSLNKAYWPYFWGGGVGWPAVKKKPAKNKKMQGNRRRCWKGCSIRWESWWSLLGPGIQWVKELHQQTFRPSWGSLGCLGVSRVTFVSSNQTCRNKKVNSGSSEDTMCSTSTPKPSQTRNRLTGLANLNSLIMSMATSDPRTDGNESSKPSRFLGIKMMRNDKHCHISHKICSSTKEI